MNDLFPRPLAGEVSVVFNELNGLNGPRENRGIERFEP